MRITDFGQSSRSDKAWLEKEKKNVTPTVHRYTEQYRAPELHYTATDDTTSASKVGSLPADVWAFSLVALEVCLETLGR